MASTAVLEAVLGVPAVAARVILNLRAGPVAGYSVVADRINDKHTFERTTAAIPFITEVD